MMANLCHCSSLHIHLFDSYFFGFFNFDKDFHRYSPYLCLYWFFELAFTENSDYLIVVVILSLINLFLFSKTQFITILV